MASGTTVKSAALEKAQKELSKFRARLTGPQLQQIPHTTFENLQQEIRLIQEVQENERKMMNLSRIQSFLEAMHNFGKVIEVFLNVTDALAFIWGPIKFLLLVGPILRSHESDHSLFMADC